MNRLLLSICLVLAMFAAVVPSFADTATVNGVLAQERVVNLPQDQGKWYVSVVGDANDARYQQLLSWFDTNEQLKGLRDQVHYYRIRTDGAMYRDRYAPNVKGLPTVRVQDASAVVIYEAAGANIPMTPEGLYGAIANDVSKVTGRPLLLPWRRNHTHPNNGPCPTPNPNPNPVPVPPDPPAPPLDPGPSGPPKVDTQGLNPYVLLGPSALACFVVGLAIGYGKKLLQKIRS